MANRPLCGLDDLQLVFVVADAAKNERIIDVGRINFHRYSYSSEYLSELILSTSVILIILIRKRFVDSALKAVTFL